MLLVFLLGADTAPVRDPLSYSRAARAESTGPITSSTSTDDVLPNFERTAIGTGPAPEIEGFVRLPAIAFRNRSGGPVLRAKLYLPSGELDERVASELDVALSDKRDPKQPKTMRIERRLLQLLYRTAYHFGATQIEVTSAYRFQQKKREGLHGLGKAIDFSIPGVKTEVLASYLRSLPRVGVGIYSHRRTRFVHLDVREHSYHWLDASPPGRTWRGMSIGDRSLASRDSRYTPTSDWPEGLMPPNGS